MTDTTKLIAIKLAGIKTDFPQSPYEPPPQAKFDRLWPRDQARFYKMAEDIERTGK